MEGKKIYIAGCGGMLGDAFYKSLIKKNDLKCTDIDLNEDWLEFLDIRNLNSYEESVQRFNPDYLFHLGALTSLEECEASCFEDSWNDDEILLCPPNRTKKLNVKDVKGKRVMRLTGWAIDYASGSAYGRTMMPYSDHADFKQLLNYVGQSGADEIYTVNGFPDLSEYLINLGYRSRHLG